MALRESLQEGWGEPGEVQTPALGSHQGQDGNLQAINPPPHPLLPARPRPALPAHPHPHGPQRCLALDGCPTHMASRDWSGLGHEVADGPDTGSGRRTH